MIAIGTTVKILNENAYGIVVKILDQGHVLVQIDDFQYSYPVEQVIIPENPAQTVQHKKLSDKINDLYNEKQDAITPEKKVKLRKGKKSPYIREVDLHSHSLLDTTAGMTGAAILNYQLDYFVRVLNETISRKERQLVVIHGKGEGVLRSEVHRILKSYNNLVFFEAPLRYYGGGATMVEIR